jgi:hypothetical protein
VRRPGLRRLATKAVSPPRTPRTRRETQGRNKRKKSTISPTGGDEFLHIDGTGSVSPGFLQGAPSSLCHSRSREPALTLSAPMLDCFVTASLRHQMTEQPARPDFCGLLSCLSCSHARRGNTLLGRSASEPAPRLSTCDWYSAPTECEPEAFPCGSVGTRKVRRRANSALFILHPSSFPGGL